VCSHGANVGVFTGCSAANADAPVQVEDESTESNHGEAWNRKGSQPRPEQIHGLWAAARNTHEVGLGVRTTRGIIRWVFRAMSASCG
jgi:hypothetical protein